MRIKVVLRVGVLFLLAVLLGACGDDPPLASTPPVDVVGRWSFDAYIMDMELWLLADGMAVAVTDPDDPQSTVEYGVWRWEDGAIRTTAYVYDASVLPVAAGFPPWPQAGPVA